MSYIGNTNTTQAFTPAIDYFSGNGSTVAFTLSRSVASAVQVQVVIENVPQNPGSAFTVSGSTVTFTSAPPSGTNNIYVYYTSPITQVIAPGQGTVGLVQLNATGTPSASTYLRGDNSWQGVSPTVVSDQANTSTGFFAVPAGTTAQRPANPAAGYIRYNTSLSYLEWYSPFNSSWKAFTFTPVSSFEYLVVAGGGGGQGRYYGGGGGAGGFVYGTYSASSAGVTYPIVVGGGGGGGGAGSGGSNGNNSTLNTSTAVAIGGGGGGGASGGSGGGSNGGSGGAGTSGQGYAGAGKSTNTAGGGGGGAAGVGLTATSSGNRQSGGPGIDTYSTWLNACSVGSGGYCCGGGGGAMDANVSGYVTLGGAGGGGNGGADYTYSTTQPTAGATNSGGGGGAGCWNNTSNGASGGSGFVIVRYAGTQVGTGGTVVTSGGYTYHVFTTSGNFVL